MSSLPIETLELRALEQRNHLHQSATELKAKVSEARENLDVAKKAREHFVGAAVIVGIVGLLSGYGVAGMFVRD